MALTELLLVRHGESVANVRSGEAYASSRHDIETPVRDADVELTDRGGEQARDVGRLLVQLDRARPAVWCSPFLRARRTAQIALEEAGFGLDVRIDERLRDRDLGLVDRLTAGGIAARHPGEAARRRWHGKFYYRPAGGESWTDVALRVRSFLRDVDAEPAVQRAGGRLLVSCHDVVVLSFRYVCQRLGEDDLLTLSGTVPNGSITRLRREDPDAPWTLLGVDQSGG